MRKLAFWFSLLFGTSTAHVRAQAADIGACLDAERVARGIFSYRQQDSNGVEIGSATREWSDVHEAGEARLRLVLESVTAEDFHVRQVFELAAATLFARAASVTMGGNEVFNLRVAGGRVSGSVVTAGGAMQSVDQPFADTDLLPGMALALLPLIDWSRCDSVAARAFYPPASIEVVNYQRVREEPVTIGSTAVDSYAISFRQRDRHYTIHVSKSTPFRVLRQYDGIGTFVLTR